MCDVVFFFQAEDGIRDLVRSRGLGDVYKRQPHDGEGRFHPGSDVSAESAGGHRSYASHRVLFVLSLIHI